MASRWRRNLTELFEQAGLGKPRNIMRKSGGTYHYHATGDEPGTQDMMGHCEDSRIFGFAYRALNFASLAGKALISDREGIAYYRLWRNP